MNHFNPVPRSNHHPSASFLPQGSNPKTTLYVGGLDDAVNEAILHSAFIPFGDIKEVSMPIDAQSGNHRGFGFVEFLDKEDAGAAIENMHNAELYNRVLKVNYALPAKIRGGTAGTAGRAVWADADEWTTRQLQEEQVRGQTLETSGVGGGDPMHHLEKSVVGS